METNAHTPNGLAPPLPASPAADVLLWGALPHLHLNIAQTALLCGVSVRQLGYWTKQGYVTASGRGARRMYGLDALRRVLAIKAAMANGASLRQALRTLPEAIGAAGTPPGDGTRLVLDAPAAAVSASPTPKVVEALSAELLALFAANRHTRDDALGLAVKVGRSSTDIRVAAERLCSQGILGQKVAQGSVVFESVRKAGS